MQLTIIEEGELLESISRKNINLGCAFIVLFAITLVTGSYYRISFVFAGIFLLACDFIFINIDCEKMFLNKRVR